MDAQREQAVAWLMEWYAAHPHVAPWQVEAAPDLIDPRSDERLPARQSRPAAGVPAEHAELIRAEGYVLSMIAKARLMATGQARDGDRVRPIGWQR